MGHNKKKEENRKPRKKSQERECQVGPEYPGEGAVIL